MAKGFTVKASSPKAKEKKEAEAKQKAQDEINFRKSAISTIEKLATDNKRLNEEALRNKKKTTKGTKAKVEPSPD